MRSYPAALTFTLASVSFTCSPVAGFSSYLENMNAPASAKVPVAPAGSSGSYLATMSSISYSTPNVSAVPVVQASPASQEVASSFGNYLDSINNYQAATSESPNPPAASSNGSYLDQMSSVTYSTPTVTAVFVPPSHGKVAEAQSNGSYLDSL